MEFKTVLCPIDGSEYSARALDAAEYICKLSGAKLILLHVVEKWYRSEAVTTDSAEWQDIHKGWLSEGREFLDGTAQKIQDRGIQHIDTILEEGDAPHEIIALSKERNVDLLVMASHRHTVVGHLFAGSTIDKIITHLHCPVMWIF